MPAAAGVLLTNIVYGTPAAAYVDMKRVLSLLNNKTVNVTLRVGGFCLLSGFFLLRRDFSFSSVGAIAYVTAAFGISYLIAVLKIAERYPPVDQYHFVPRKELQRSVSMEDWALKQAIFLESGFRGIRIFFTPSEDALICVPILLVGINPITAMLGGALFGALHLARFTYLECIGKAIIYSFACYFILPYGLLTIVAGHFTSDLAALLILKALRRHIEQRRPS